VKRSKLLTALGVYYLLLSTLNLLGISDALNRDWLYLTQAILGIGLGLALAVGLLRQLSWTIAVFVSGALLLIILNWFWLRANPPEGMFWGTKWLIAVVLNLFPGCLLFLRRDEFRSGLGKMNTEEANA